MSAREFVARLCDWLRRERLDGELREELDFHRAALERDAQGAQGAQDAQDAQDARHLAKRRLGNETRIREESRDAWSVRWLDVLQQDLRYALRGLRRTPAFTATVIVTLGLGIGANAAMFGVIDRLMFRPFPYLREPSRVHRVYLQQDSRGSRSTTQVMEYTRYRDLQRWTTSFDHVAGMAQAMLAVGSGQAARERRVAMVSASFFDFFAARPVRGRFFVASEDTTPRGAPVAVLGHGYWKSELGQRDVLGEVIQVGNVAATIIGIAPEGFIGVTSGEAPAVFIPITTYAGSGLMQDDPTSYYTKYNWGWMYMMARRKPGVPLAQASQDLSNAYLRSWTAELAQDDEGTPAAVARPRAIAGALRRAGGPDAGLESATVRWVTGVAVIVLLIACANVANLMLARALRRRRETAVRLALGVSRGRLVAQSLTESLLLAGLGAIAGVLMAQWGGAALRRFFVSEDSALAVIADGRTIIVVAIAALAAAVLTGVGPALLVTGADLAGSLKAGAREGTRQRSRTRGALLILQGALSVILLVGAALFVRSLNNVRHMPLGFDDKAVLLVMQRGVQLTDSGRAQLGRRLLDAARAIPGVDRAALVSSIPFWSTSGTDLFVAGIDSVSRLGRFSYQTATPDYFAAIGTRVLRGRPFTALDHGSAPKVAVVSAAMAKVLWPDRDALGECLRVGADTVPCTTVVGIAEDAVQTSLQDDDTRLRYYLPLDQVNPARGHTVMLRMRGDPAADVEGVRAALQRVMPGDAYVAVRLFRDVIAEQQRSWHLGAMMFVAFGMLALIVAAVGLYGVIGYDVAQRRHELGVRIALGARSADILTLVAGRGVRFAAAGVAAGTAIALVAGRWMQPLLFQQSARDPLVFSLVGGVLLLVALAACAGPALRAARADPNTALRAE